jgi:hypothetical protein
VSSNRCLIRSIRTIRDARDDTCKEAELTEVEGNVFRQRMLPDPFVFERAPLVRGRQLQ